MLTDKEKERYNRHLIVKEFGQAGQEKLKAARVLVVGAGGLGCPIIQYLTAAGVGHLGIVDGDLVSLSNLQRQILYAEDEVGQLKAQIAVERMHKLNSHVELQMYADYLTEESADAIIKQYDVIIGATDNFASRYLIDESCEARSKPYVHGSIHEFEGQVAVFHLSKGPSYRKLFPQTPNKEDLSLGVMGVLPGIVGSFMALEAIKIITGLGDVLDGEMLVYNALQNSYLKLGLGMLA